MTKPKFTSLSTPEASFRETIASTVLYQRTCEHLNIFRMVGKAGLWGGMFRSWWIKPTLALVQPVAYQDVDCWSAFFIFRVFSLNRGFSTESRLIPLEDLWHYFCDVLISLARSCGMTCLGALYQRERRIRASFNISSLLRTRELCMLERLDWERRIIEEDCADDRPHTHAYRRCYWLQNVGPQYLLLDLLR